VPVDSIEAYYPMHAPEQVALYLDYARRHGLLVSSGSDSHGPEKTPVKYRAELSRHLLERLGIQVE
jgi:3',5'-nucleoside bisphosphate phosphatase